MHLLFGLKEEKVLGKDDDEDDHSKVTKDRSQPRKLMEKHFLAPSSWAAVRS